MLFAFAGCSSCVDRTVRAQYSALLRHAAYYSQNISGNFVAPAALMHLLQQSGSNMLSVTCEMHKFFDSETYRTRQSESEYSSVMCCEWDLFICMYAACVCLEWAWFVL